MVVNQELLSLSQVTKNYLRNHFVEFLETKHSQKTLKKTRHAAAEKHLKPVEAFEYEIKHRLSNAAHEVLHAITRIEESKKAKSAADLKDFLRYARTSLEEADRELDAAESLNNSLSTYEQRVSESSTVLGHEVRPIMDDLFAKTEQLRALQRALSSKISSLLGTGRT